MAAVEDPLRTVLRETSLKSANKENRPPPQQPRNKRKHTVDVSTLFSYPKKARSEHVETSDPSTENAASSRKARASQDPVYLNFLETTKLHRDGVACSKAKSLKATYETLTQRVHGFDINDNVSKREKQPSQAETEACTATEATLGQPLSKQTFQGTYSKAGRLEVREVPLGEAMASFAKEVEMQRKHMQKLQTKLSEMEQEIASITASLADNIGHDGESLQARLEAELQALQSEMDTATLDMLRDVVTMQKDEKQITANFNKKVADFFKNLVD